MFAKDPDCPEHGVEAQEHKREQEADRADLLQQIAELRAELAAMRAEAARQVGSTPTNRELLEAAANAAGLDHNGWHYADGSLALNGFNDRRWNPLTNDGDALRLAVKLGFIAPGRWPDAGLIALEQWGEAGGKVDWCEATRRAIVRAAADIAERCGVGRRGE